MKQTENPTDTASPRVRMSPIVLCSSMTLMAGWKDRTVNRKNTNTEKTQFAK